MKRLTSALISVIMLLCFGLAGCDSLKLGSSGDGSGEGETIQLPTGYDPSGNTAENSGSLPEPVEPGSDTAVNDDIPIEQDKVPVTEQEDYLFGMGEIPYDLVGGATDSGVTMQMVADLAGALGVKSFRVWMHITSLAEIDRTNRVHLKPEETKRYHTFFKALNDAGITHITAMSHYYLYPANYAVKWGSIGNVIPNPEEELDDYVQFMDILSSTYELFAAEFPEVTYWEPGNETNDSHGRFIAKNGYDSRRDETYNVNYFYTQDELARITADMCWYANAGVKKSNPNAMIVLPGMIFDTNGNTAKFLQKIYDQISICDLPSGKAVDTDEDNYFQVLNWHPYAFGTWDWNQKRPNDDWINGNQDIYEVAKQNGDGNKKVFLTEIGWPDQGAKTTQDWVAEAFPTTIDVIKEKMPWVETFHTFRMFDWVSNDLAPDSIERSFGLFTSPYNGALVSPKPVALALFKYFNGENADASALYKYAKV